MTEEEIRKEEATSERVSFTCDGCGRDTTIHVGVSTYLPEKRCMKCRGTNRSGRAGAPAVKGRRMGTHEGRRKSDALRAVKRAASQRNASRQSGYVMGNKLIGRKPCRSYDECNHRKHSVAKGR